MPQYRVVWEIDIFDADSHEEAAQKALLIQRNPESIATVFNVSESPYNGTAKIVDLTPDDDDNTCEVCGGEIGTGGVESTCADCVEATK